MSEVNLAGQPASRLMEALGLVVDEHSADERGGCTSVRGHIDAGADHHTPLGIVHGALYSGAIETAASVGATLAVLDSGQVAVGVDNVTDFIRPVQQGRLDVRARAVNQGKTLQLWEVEITDDRGRLVARGRVRLANRPRPAAAPPAEAGAGATPAEAGPTPAEAGPTPAEAGPTPGGAG